MTKRGGGESELRSSDSECNRYKLLSESDKKGRGITEELELPHAEVN